MPRSTSGGNLEQQRQRRARVLGQQIRSHRGSMSQAQLGDALAKFQPDGRAIPQNTISRLEGGHCELTAEQLWDLEEALKVRHGTLAAAAGYVQETSSLEEAILRDSELHPDFHHDLIVHIRAYKEASKVAFAKGSRSRNGAS